MVKDDQEHISLKLSKEEKENLLRLARKKGCEGLTQFFRMLSKAKKIEIDL